MAFEFQPNYEKIVELLLYLAHKKPNADKYQAVKFFYLADREHISTHGRPITFEQYFALPFGPVASKTMDLLEGDRQTMRQAKIQTLPFNTYRIARPNPGKRDLVVIGNPKREVDRDVFSKSDLKVFDWVLEKFGNYDFDQLYNITHKHAAYKRAWANRGNSRASPMKYEDMIESPELRASIVRDIGPVSAHL